MCPAPRARLTMSAHAERIEKHRADHEELTFQYGALPNSAQGASAAKQIETDCIHELSEVHGVHLISSRDGRTHPRRVSD